MPSLANKLASLPTPFPDIVFESDNPLPFDITASGSDDYIDFTGWDPPNGYYYRVHGGAGNDTIIGTNKKDEFWGDQGNDELYGMGGNDVLFGGAGHDYVDGGDGRDLIYAGLGNDGVDGGADDDTLFGGSGNDTIVGNTGNDHLYGDPGDDTLDGGAGDDVLQGNRDWDTLVGGTGADRFVFTETDSSFEYIFPFGWLVLHRFDTILDFNPGEGDKLDLSALIDNQSWVSVSGAEQAVVSGVIYFIEQERNGMVGTDVMFDYNGAVEGHDVYADSFTIAHLAGIRASTIPLDSLIV